MNGRESLPTLRVSEFTLPQPRTPRLGTTPKSMPSASLGGAPWVFVRRSKRANARQKSGFWNPLQRGNVVLTAAFGGENFFLARNLRWLVLAIHRLNRTSDSRREESDESFNLD